MRRKQFVEYLITRYRGRAGRSLSAKGASDAASRLKRLESILDFDIDEFVIERSTQTQEEILAVIDTKIGELSTINIPAHALIDGRRVVRKYIEFVRWEAQQAQALEWARNSPTARE